MVAGTYEYFRQFPNGVMPGATFMAEWLKPFIELECMECRMDELHQIQGNGIRVRERELVDQRQVLARTCQVRIQNGGMT